jgi:hypothetical protein
MRGILGRNSVQVKDRSFTDHAWKYPSRSAHSGRIVGNPYLEIISGLPAIRTGILGREV